MGRFERGPEPLTQTCPEIGDGVALAQYGSTLYAAFTGKSTGALTFAFSPQPCQQDQPGPWTVYLPGFDSKPQNVPDSGPLGLAAFRGTLWLAYKKKPEPGKKDGGEHYMTHMTAPNVWSEPELMRGFTSTSKGIALATFQGRLYAACACLFPDATAPVVGMMVSDDGKSWKGINGGTSLTPLPIIDARTTFAPSLAAYKNRLYLAFQWPGGLKPYDPGNLLKVCWSSNGSQWSDGGKPANILPNGSPSLAAHEIENRLYLAWPANDSSDILYLAWMGDDLKWSAPDGYSQASLNYSLAIASFEEQLRIVYRPKGSDRIQTGRVLVTPIDGRVKNWMSLLRIADKKLTQIALPGTHDSGAYRFEIRDFDPYVPQALKDILRNFPDSVWGPAFEKLSQAQDTSVYQQLERGVRRVDLRIMKYNNELRLYHGLICMRVEEVLDALKLFVKNTRRELVIVQMSHMSTLTPDDHARLYQSLQERVQDYLYKDVRECLGQTLREMTKDGSRLLMLYDDARRSNHPEVLGDPNALIWSPSLPVTGTSSPEWLLAEIQRQLDAYTGDKLVSVSFCLTPQESEIEGMVVAGRGLRELAYNINVKIAEFLRLNALKRINIATADWFETSPLVNSVLSRNI